MNQIWRLSVDDYLEIVELAKQHGKKPGDSMEAELREVMEKKNIKPAGCTELTKEEILREVTSKGQKVLHMNVDNDGTTKFVCHKPKENTDEC